MNVRGVMDGTDARNNCWVVNKENLEEDEEDIIICDSSTSSSIGSFSEDSMNSVCSSSSSELAEDASSSSTNYLSISSSSSTHSNGPLYELSDLVNNLPLKRGLSMFYKGKAQSFTSLARVGSIEDLPKKEKPYKKKMKSCKSFGGGLDGHHRRTPYSPHATISKKASRGSSFASLLSKRGSFIGGSSRSTSIAERNNF